MANVDYVIECLVNAAHTGEPKACRDKLTHLLWTFTEARTNQDGTSASYFMAFNRGVHMCQEALKTITLE